MKSNNAQSKAEKAIKLNYGISRALTLAEIRAEAVSLLRKNEKGNMDDSQERIFSCLQENEWKKLAE